MELHNDEVPGDAVWALLVIGNGTYEEHRYVHWFLTPEASSEEYRYMTDFHKRSAHGGTVQRWKVILPRRRMPASQVKDFVEDQLLWHSGPTEHTRVLDVSVQPGKGDK